jgi:hypothetical protein
MSSVEPKVASYSEFTENVLPRVAALGYNTIQVDIAPNCGGLVAACTTVSCALCLRRESERAANLLGNRRVPLSEPQAFLLILVTI